MMKHTTKNGIILGGKRFAAITAVEGLKLSAAAKGRLADMDAKNISSAQRRAEVIRAYQDPAKKRNG